MHFIFRKLETFLVNKIFDMKRVKEAVNGKLLQVVQNMFPKPLRCIN